MDMSRESGEEEAATRGMDSPMDYQQYVYGRPDFEVHKRGRGHRPGRFGRMTRLIGAVAVALAALLWLAGVQSAAEFIAAPVASPDVPAMPAVVAEPIRSAAN